MGHHDHDVPLPRLRRRRARHDQPLPDLDVLLTLHVGNGAETYRADLWTVLFEPDEGRFSMVWGYVFSVGKQPSRVRSVAIDVDGAMAADVAT